MTTEPSLPSLMEAPNNPETPFHSENQIEIVQKVSDDLEKIFDDNSNPKNPEIPSETQNENKNVTKVSDDLEKIFEDNSTPKNPEILSETQNKNVIKVSDDLEKIFEDNSTPKNPEIPSETQSQNDNENVTKVSDDLEKIFEDTKTVDNSVVTQEKDNLLDELEKVIEEKAKEIVTEVEKETSIEDKLKEIVGEESFEHKDADMGSKEPFFDDKSLNFELQNSGSDIRGPEVCESEKVSEIAKTQIQNEPFCDDKSLNFKLQNSGSDIRETEVGESIKLSETAKTQIQNDIVMTLVENNSNLNQKESNFNQTVESDQIIMTLVENPPLEKSATNSKSVSNELQIDSKPVLKFENTSEIKKGPIISIGPDLDARNPEFLKEYELQKAETKKILPVIKKVVPEYQIKIRGNAVSVSISGEEIQKSAEEKENIANKTLGESKRAIEKRSIIVERHFPEEDESLLVEQISETDTPKRKRGRPRKTHADPDPPFSPFGSKKKPIYKRPAPVSPETTTTANGEPKRKRGRPRKHLGFGFHNIVAEVKNIKLPSSKWSVHINPGSETRQVCFTKSEIKNGDSTPVVERLVKFMGGKNFFVKINNKLVELIGSPKTVESLEDVEILLMIVNDIQSNDSLIKSYIR